MFSLLYLKRGGNAKKLFRFIRVRGYKNRNDSISTIRCNAVPVVVAGGIYERKDMDHCLGLGAKGVQIATRFVTTRECDASDAYKEAYIEAKKEDIVIVKSPVGMPGRAIHNAFLDKVNAGERFMRGCRQCIITCKPDTAPYCITEALINAVEGRLDEGLIFCGSNAYRADKIETVAEIMEEFS